MERLSDVLDRALKRAALDSKLQDYRVWSIWKDAVGSLIARHAQPHRIRHGTLFVTVSDATWMQQLHYMRAVLKDKLNQRLERHTVKNIFFVLGELPGREMSSEDPAARTGRQRPMVPDVSGERSSADDQLMAVGDPELRSILKRLSAQIRSREKGGTEE